MCINAKSATKTCQKSSWRAAVRVSEPDAPAYLLAAEEFARAARLGIWREAGVSHRAFWAQ